MTNNKTQKNIPKEWQESNLGAICIFKKGKGLSKNDILVKGKNRCIHYGELFTKYNEKIDKILSLTNVAKDKMFLSKVNDILMPTSDVTPRGLSTASCIMENDIILGGDVLVIRCKNKKLNGLFFSYYISARKKDVIRLVSGSTVFHLYGSDMARFKFLLPPLPEQNRIVAVLETWDKYLEKLNRKIEIKKNIKKGLMQRLLSGDVRLEGFSGEWKMVKLGDVCKINRGEMIIKNNTIIGSVPVIAGGKQPAYFHNVSNYTGKTITVSGSGASAGYVNYFNIPIFASDCSVVKALDKTDIDYIYYFLKNEQEYIYSLQSGGAQPHVYPRDLIRLKINIPSLKEQTAIANILTTADQEIEALEKKKKIIEEQKKYLLNNLVTGQIRTPDDL